MTRVHRKTLLRLVGVLIAYALTVGTGWAFWTEGSIPGGNGASATVTVNQGATPTVNAVGRTVTVNWAASTLSNGNAVAGYRVKRYDVATLTAQTMLSACTGTVAATTCTESSVPAGQWVYSVTPLFATNWSGAESAKSSSITVAAPTLVLTSTTAKPGTLLTGTAAGLIGGETLQYRLDSTGGTILTGSLAGSATPATIPAGGGGAVSITVPAGTSEGAHTIYAVASPSGVSASAGIVVDSTPPPVPVLTLTPASPSGDTVTFAFTEAEATATLDCNLDGAAFASCGSPVDYTPLTAGSHTFNVRATDSVGNVSATTSYTWTVNLTIPTISIAFPTVAGLYNDSGFNAGCGTASTGDICGTGDDDVGVTAVDVSVRRLSDNKYWNGTSFSATPETWAAATGTADWTYAFLASAFSEGGYTVRARATDAANNRGYDSRTITIDRTAPAAPTLTSVPPATSGPSATLTFTTADSTAGFECKLDSGAFASCSSPQTYDNLLHGSHTVTVRAVDGAGNISTTASTTWTVDATAPTASMTFPTATGYNLAGWIAGCGTAATGDMCGTASDVGSGLTTVAISIRRVSTNRYWDGSSFAATTETWLAAAGTASWSYGFAGTSFPTDGGYTVRWQATDAVGNTGVGGVDLTLDTVAPPTPQINQAPSNPGGPFAQFGFSDTEAGTGADCRLDSALWATCTTPADYTGLSNGSHTFSVRATDAAGNVSTIASYTWTVDVGLPSISISFPNAGATYNNTTYAAGCGTPAADLCGTASDPGGSVSAVAVSIRRNSTSLYWSGTSFSSATEVYLAATGTTAWSYDMTAASFPADDSYALHARATDNTGFTAIDAVTMTIDRTAPVAPTITSGPSGTTAGGDTFSFTAEAGATFECRLDAGSWVTCASPKTYGALTDGSHTFDVRAIDGASNTGATTSRTWTVDATAPSIGTTFPVAGTPYINTTWDAGCLAGTGDICGTASDARSSVSKIEVSVQRASTGLYLTGTTFSAPSQNWIIATGTTSWTYALAATTFMADGTYTLVVRATDSLGNAGTSSTAFVIDRTKPTGTGFTTTNVGIARKVELGDTFTLTYSESIDPASIIAGWNGATSQNVVVHATNGNGSGTDKLTVYNSTNTTLLPLGSVNLKRNDYVSATMTFGLTGTVSTLTMSGSNFTITIGTPSGTPTVAAAVGNVAWTPAIGAKDIAGNAAATTIYTETDNDSDF